MKKTVFGHWLKHLFGIIIALSAFSAVVMLLWNALLPSIFGVAAINLWQALGLLVLARIFFSGMGGFKRFMGMGMHNHHNPMREKWLKMTPEERKEFVKNRHFGPRGFGRDFEHEFCKQDESEKQD
ncbi:MAG: hypothetical protein LBT04_03660 [Prevotellaceae bacterium]|jgi:hypothetical protein|nr:hypothetical protein [Prevotellaceae bacterium]